MKLHCIECMQPIYVIMCRLLIDTSLACDPIYRPCARKISICLDFLFSRFHFRIVCIRFQRHLNYKYEILWVYVVFVTENRKRFVYRNFRRMLHFNEIFKCIFWSDVFSLMFFFWLKKEVNMTNKTNDAAFHLFKMMRLFVVVFFSGWNEWSNLKQLITTIQIGLLIVNENARGFTTFKFQILWLRMENNEMIE